MQRIFNHGRHRITREKNSFAYSSLPVPVKKEQAKDICKEKTRKTVYHVFRYPFVDFVIAC